MSIIKRKVNTVIKKPASILIKLLYSMSPLITDRRYLKLLFPLRTGYKLNLDNPKTFNEKLQWLKINYRRPELTRMVDKYEAKSFVAELIGDKFIVKNYGIWNSFDDIDFDSLPNQFVLKTTHDQGGVVICRDKKVFDYVKARKKLTKHLKFEHYYLTREWPYKNVKPRILAEELLVDNTKGDIWDYKFYCFNGEPKAMYISMGRQGDHIPFYFYDMDFNLLNLQRPGHEYINGADIDKPDNWNRMLELAKQLSKGIPHVRVDFYDIDGRLLVGELTMYQGGGMMPFIPKEWDYALGSWIDLELVK